MDCHVGILKGGAYGGTRNDNISIWFDRSYILACNDYNFSSPSSHEMGYIYRFLIKSRKGEYSAHIPLFHICYFLRICAGNPLNQPDLLLYLRQHHSQVKSRRKACPKSQHIIMICTANPVYRQIQLFCVLKP